MIFTERKITVRKGKSSIDESVILYRGDFEVELRFTIMETKYRFKSGVNLVDSEKAAHAQLALLAPDGTNVFTEIGRCEDGTAIFVLSKEMIDELSEVGLYSFQIRLFDYYRESRITIPPVEFGIEVREPIAAEDHTNAVDDAMVGYSIAKTSVLDEPVPETFDDNGQYNKTDWETGDRISEGKLNKIEDAIDQINQNEINDVAALDKRVTNNFNTLNSTKANIQDVNNKIWGMANMSQEVKEAMTGGSVAVVGKDSILTENIVDKQVTPEKVSFIYSPEFKNLFNKLDPEIVRSMMLNGNGTEISQTGMYISGKIPVKPNTKYTMSRIQSNWGVFYDASGKVLDRVTSSPSSDLRPGTITTPANTAYMRINGYTLDIDSYMVVEGEIMPDLYTPYDSKIRLNDNVTSNSIDKMISEYNKDVYSAKMINMFDKNHSDNIHGVYTTGSSNKESIGYSLTHLIPVKVGVTYTAKRYKTKYGSNVVAELYDDKGNKIGYSLWEVMGDIEPIDDLYFKFTVPENVSYVRLNVITSDIDNFMVVEGDTYPSEYSPCYKYYPNDPIYSHFKNESVNLFDKNHPAIVRGKWRSSSTTTRDASNAFISHPIPVEPDKTYKFRHEKGVYGKNFIVSLMSQSRSYYDMNITGTVDPDGFAVFTIPEATETHNVQYVTVNGWLTDIDNFMLTEIDLYPEEYESFNVSLKDVNIDALNENIRKVNELETDFNRLNKNFNQRANLFDKTNPDIPVAFLTSWTGSMNTNYTSYLVSHLIEVECGKTYRWPAGTKDYGSNNQQIVAYDKDGIPFKEFNLFAGLVTTDENDINEVTIPYNPLIKYVRVNLLKDEIDSFMFVESNTYPETYIPYGYDIGSGFEEAIKNIALKVVPEIPEVSGGVVSKLQGKIVSFNGDSISAGAGSKGGYGLVIANRFDMVYENISVGGGTITAEQYSSATGSARHWISRTISNMRADADYVILEGGVNDSSLKVPLGEVSSGYTATLDDTTFCGAMESMCKAALARFPGKKIGFVIVHKMTTTYLSTNPDYQYYFKTKEICEKWGIPYLDLNVECPPLGMVAHLKETYTHNQDGWHPNALGYEKYYVDPIIAFMERL